MRISLTIIIPTHNRQKLLKKALSELVKQADINDRIIVVDNVSTDETKRVVSSFSKNKNVLYIYEPSPGPSFARNTGFARAKTAGIAFLDDDCSPSPGWINQIKEVLAGQSAYQKVIHQGKIVQAYSKKSLISKFLAIKYWVEAELCYGGFTKGRLIDFIHAGNFFALKRDLVTIKPLFDSQVFPYVGEERDFAYRLQLAGYAILYHPEISVKHNPTGRQTFIGIMHLWYLYGRALGILSRRYEAKSKKKQIFFPKTQFDSADNTIFTEIIRSYKNKPFQLIGIILLFYLQKGILGITSWYYRGR